METFTASHDQMIPDWGPVLEPLFDALNVADIKYCIQHGYEGYPRYVPPGKDIDIIMPAEVLPRALASAIRETSYRIDVSLVLWTHRSLAGHCFILARQSPVGSPHFLVLDVYSDDLMPSGSATYREDDFLRSCRQHKNFWVPPPALEFGSYVPTKVAKGSLDDGHGQRLSQLYREDPPGCEREVARFWGTRSSQVIISAARSGNWDEVRSSMRQLRGEMLRRLAINHPLQTGRYWVSEVARWARRWLQPTGLHGAILGPDGSGKSSVIAAVGQDLAPAFHHRGWSSGHFAPALFRRNSLSRPVTEPHAAPPRSFLASVAKALYWLADFTAGYHLILRPALVRSKLVLFDRYLMDAIVDPGRYRYGGPAWLLRLIWWIVPKPNLIILLDAPAVVLQARKQEVPYEETVRQRATYRALVAKMPNGRIVDASQPFDKVVADVNEVVLQFLAARTARRLGLEPER